jgi:hypothetical protein
MKRDPGLIISETPGFASEEISSPWPSEEFFSPWAASRDNIGRRKGNTTKC